jgi:septal ring factor EnvC (AmiA/AmiB activator)
MLAMLGLNPFRLAGIIAAIAVIAGVVFYVKHNESVKEQLLAENAQLQASINIYKDAIQTQEDTINYMEEQQKKRAQEFLRIESTFAQIRADNQEMSDKLLDLDISLNAAENPQAAEVIINDISNNMNRCFEILSGAPLKESPPVPRFEKTRRIFRLPRRGGWVTNGRPLARRSTVCCGRWRVRWG